MLTPRRVHRNSRAVGVVLRPPDGEVAGAPSVAAIDDRMDPERCASLAALLPDEVPKAGTRLRDLFRRAAILPGGEIAAG